MKGIGLNIPSRALLQHDVKPRKFVATDIVGHLSYVRNYCYVLTMLDHNSRYLEAIPLQRIDATTVARTFLKNWVYRHGPPRILHSDRGTQLESMALKEIRIQKNHTTPYRPQGNSCLESAHRT